MGRYRGADGWWQKAVLKPEKTQWGGEVVAGKLTDYRKSVGTDVPEADQVQPVGGW
jgi:hypothetical protein